MSNSLDARNTPEALVGDMPVFAALSAIKEEAENPLHDTDPEKQHERMVTLFEDAVAAVLYTMVGDQSLAEPTRKALRNKMLANDQVRFKAERIKARKSALAAVNPKEAKKKAKMAKRTRKLQASELTDPITTGDDESTEDDTPKAVVHAPAPVRLSGAPKAYIDVPAGSWWEPGFISAAVHAQTNVRLGLQSGALPAAHAPLPVPWWVGVPVPAAQAAQAANIHNEVVDLVDGSD